MSNYTTTIEEWRDIPDYEGVYQVSNLGHVRRIGKASGTTPGFILKPRQGTSGYLFVALSIKGRKRNFMIHRLVLLAFDGPCPDGYQCNHIDMDKHNNHLDNLEWVSPGDNSRHAHQNKSWEINSPKGEDCHSAKLTEEQVQEIRYRYETEDISQVDLAKEYPVNSRSINMIVNRKSWKHVD